MEALSWISFVAFLFCNSGVVGSAVGVGVDLEKEVAKVDEKFLSVSKEYSYDRLKSFSVIYPYPTLFGIISPGCHRLSRCC